MNQPTALTASILTSLVLLIGGCHYRVTNPESGRTYYTKDYKDYKQSGSIRFKDHRSGKTVTLDSWETEQISEEEFLSNVENDG